MRVPRPSPSRFLTIAVVVLAALLMPAVSHAQLSQNSGINSSDTWASFDVSAQTQVISSNISVPAIAQTYHMEIGYDINGKLVANVWPTGSSSIATDSGQVSVIRLSQGNVAVFDENGAPIPLQLPANAPMFNPLNLLGTNPGSSVLSQLVVSNVSTQATRTNSQLSYINSDALLAGTYSGGGSSTNYQWTYAQSGSVWVADPSELLNRTVELQRDQDALLRKCPLERQSSERYVARKRRKHRD